MKQLIHAALLVCLVSFSAVRATAAPESFKVSDLTFKRPAGWEWVETTSKMRAAQLKVTDAKTKQSGDVIFFYFGAGGGGGVKANVDRWFGQFEEPREKINAKTEEATVGKTKVTYVTAEGTYKSGQPGGPFTPMKDHMLLGAIVEANEGSIFIRLTAPKDLGKASTADFKKMIETALK
ncbi:MAG: hypothetical protein FJ386_04900 [Verrucomicrobia bacterium]|nr:hypothetical protein [Verrucomicrobiota bacterium]